MCLREARTISVIHPSQPKLTYLTALLISSWSFSLAQDPAELHSAEFIKLGKNLTFAPIWTVDLDQPV